MTNGVELLVDGRHILRIVILEHCMFRVSLKKDGKWRLPKTWSIAPEKDVPWEGRDRDDIFGFSGSDVTIELGATVVLSTPLLRLTISQPLHLSWAAKIDGDWITFTQDRPTGGIMLGSRDHRHEHYLLYNADEPVHGLGEKTGSLDRRGGRYEMRNLDAMGYDAETTDPLYKHIPFTMTQTSAAGAWSIFYDNLSSCWFDLGNELDNYHLPYRVYRAQDGDLDYYMRWAPHMLGLVKGHVRMIGGTAFPPRWTLGYSGSTMSYTDADDAQVQLEGFADQIAKHDLPCDSFQMSSGYTSIDAKRYVFHWNQDKIPDIAGLTAKFHDAQIHLIANIKPCLLLDHPQYATVEGAGLFIKDSEIVGPSRSIFWDDEGSYLDFTNPDTIAWWKEQVTSKLLDNGIGSTWNDNNEYEIWDDAAKCDGFGSSIDVGLIRPLHSVLMTRASFEAQQEHQPDKRPYLISRSGAPGIQRYAQTWSGDNRTDWKTLRYNIRTGLGMSLSGLYNVGHDVGGFAGPRPSPELFLRWVQNGIFHPRFTIHSWNDDDTVNELWMYPEIMDQIRAAMQLRYRLMPYLYTLLWQAVDANEPMLRPLFLDFPDDRDAWKETDDFMLGRDLLVANVVDQGATTRCVYLPKNETGWWDLQGGTWHEPGSEVSLQVDLNSIPLFVSAGSLIPMSVKAGRAVSNQDKELELALFPLMNDGCGQGLLFEDDGISVNAPNALVRFNIITNKDQITLDWVNEGTVPPASQFARVSVPKTELRPIKINGHEVGPMPQIIL